MGGVELAQSYHYLAEANLRPNAVRIVKAGIPGTGPSDQLKWLQVYGERYHPDLVLLSFYVGNDFTDAQMGGVSEQFTVVDGLMVKKSIDNDAGSSWFRDAREKVKHSSMLAQKGAEVIWYFENKQKAHRLYFYPNGHMNANGHRETAILLTDALREALKQKLSKTL